VRSFCLFLALGLTAFAGREGNFIIRFEPKVVLQPEVQIPFEIKVMNDLQQPLHEAKVTLQIETKDHKRVQVFKAPEVTEGLYLAKPVFSQAGDWSILVEVHRNDQETSRVREYTIPNPKP
jgi:hypothetical protein